MAHDRHNHPTHNNTVTAEVKVEVTKTDSNFFSAIGDGIKAAGRTVTKAFTTGFDENKHDKHTIAYEQEVYKKAPQGWGEVTPDIKHRLSAVKDGTVIIQATKFDTAQFRVNKHEVENVPIAFCTMAKKHGSEYIALPIVSGGAGNGAIDFTVVGGTTKILDASNRHNDKLVLKDKDPNVRHQYWGCKVYDLEQNFHSIDGKKMHDVIAHTSARLNGSSGGCVAWPKVHQTEGENFMDGSIGETMEFLPKASGAFVINKSHSHNPENVNERLDRAQNLAKEFHERKHHAPHVAASTSAVNAPMSAELLAQQVVKRQV